MIEVVLIAQDLRSCHNVGSLLRTAEGLGVSKVYLTGYTPYPLKLNDSRLPHVAQKLHKQIEKTALGAERLQAWEHNEDVRQVIGHLKSDDFLVAGLEQAADAIALPKFKTPTKVAILLGREVTGIEPEILKLCDVTLEIPMFGQKESFNVVQAAAMTLYHCRFITSVI